VKHTTPPTRGWGKRKREKKKRKGTGDFHHNTENQLRNEKTNSDFEINMTGAGPDPRAEEEY